jgi:alpha-galactosidase
MKSALLAFALASLANASVRYIPETKVWVLDTDRTTYAIGVNENGVVQHMYWSAKIRGEDLPAPRTARSRSSFDPSETMTPEEYPAWGGMRYIEPALKATFDNGNRDVVLKYVSHRIEGETLSVRVKDIGNDLFADMIYRVYPHADIISRSVRIENRTSRKITLESAQSAVWHVPAGDGYRLSHLSGRWAGETQLIQEPIEPGKKIFESRRGNTSHNANPWFAVDKNAVEEDGPVWFGAIGWSGTWKIAVEQTPYEQVRVTGGLNDFDFA